MARIRRPNSGLLTRYACPVVLAYTLLIAGCSGAPTAEGGADTEGEPDEGGAMSLDDVYAELEGMTGDERREQLVELATGECDQQITVYTTMNVEDISPVLEQFSEDTGLDVEQYRAPNQNIVRRVLQEEDANVADVADVIAVNDVEQEILAREGILAPLNTPATEANAVVEDTWAGAYLAVYIAAWNTDEVDDSEAPTSWEEVLETDGMAYQFGDFAWFATLINDWYVEEQGMTEGEAVELVKNAVRDGAQAVDGHTLGAELLVAGEYSAASSLYHHTIAPLIEDGAPLAWEPVVEPMIVRSNGVGMHRRTPCPATSLLLTEYMLTDMQEMLPEFGRTPAVQGIPGGFPAEYDTMPMNLDLVLDNQEKWESVNEEITAAIGGEVLEED
ncbi:MAG: hypothetical protein GEU93_09230 [Propionibacteriales bacterium]|nr:hypothetical protein [Propionibacteriales bacterium]